jgi:hypothetical protein
MAGFHIPNLERRKPGGDTIRSDGATRKSLLEVGTKVSYPDAHSWGNVRSSPPPSADLLTGGMLETARQLNARTPRRNAQVLGLVIGYE